MIENKQFQELLKKYPDDAVMAIGIHYNNQTSLLYDVEVKGIAFENMKVILIMNEDLNYEYETLMNGADIDKEIYRE